MLKRPNGSIAYDYRRMLSQLNELPIDDFFLIPYFEDESDGYAVVDRFMEIVTGKSAIRLKEILVRDEFTQSPLVVTEAPCRPEKVEVNTWTFSVF